MDWFNFYGLIVVAALIMPNIISAITDKSSFSNKFNNKTLVALEQIGRYGCMAFMIFNIPYTYFGFWFSHALTVYLSVNIILIVFYYLGWFIFYKNNCIAKVLWLSITPTVLFLFNGIIVCSILLIASAIIFGIAHIIISTKNYYK